MAAKHAKKRGGGPAPVQPKGGERAFRAALAREYGVEQVPRKSHRRFEQALAELPDDIPVRPRPFYRMMFRVAAAAAVLVVSFTTLLGINTTYPQMTESLPGLGPVFQALNQGEAPATPSPEESSPPKEESQFQQVTVDSQGDFPGRLRIDSAQCDGKTLLLTLNIEPAGELADIMKDPESLGYGEAEGYILQPGITQYIYSDAGEYVEPSIEQNYTLRLTAGESGWTGFPELTDFTDNGQGELQALWRCPVDESIQASLGEELSVAIDLPDLSFIQIALDGEEYPSISWYAGFQASFTVPVERSKNRQISVPVTDNGATILSVDYTPSQVEVEMDLPLMGCIGDMLIDVKGECDPEDPLGVYPVLRGAFLSPEEGNPQASFPYELDNVSSPLKEAPVQSEKSQRVKFLFVNNYFQERCVGPLVLRIMETPMIPSRVVAEFSIDLNTGVVSASKTYLDEGLEQADTSRDSRYTRTLGCFVNGFLCCDVSLRNELDEASVILATPELKPGRTLVLNGYSQGELVQSFWVVSGEDSYAADGSFTQYVRTVPSTGEAYSVMLMTLAPPYSNQEWEGEWNGYDRLELVDGDNGQVLIDDLRQAYWDAVYTIIGRQEETAVPEQAAGGVEFDEAANG